MAEIINAEGKTVVKTDARIDTFSAATFEKELEPALVQGVNLEIDCAELTYMSSSGLRVMQATMRTVIRSLGGQMKLTHVRPEIYKILQMTGFTRHLTVEQA